MPLARARVNLHRILKKGIVFLIVLMVGGFFALAPQHVWAEGTPHFQVSDSILSSCNTSGSGFTELMVCGASFVISSFLELIVWFLGMMILLVISVLMAFASYNDFNNASIVQTGWVVVRDLTNMFFIVILLVSAFATIIGYDKASFHYKQVLPKLLLMAVLVNFSKTIILLLVDFSQVIMLTFVNAFYQSAAGNFVNGLGLTSMLRLPGSGSASGAPAVNMVNIILALALSVFLLSIMLATLIILTLYLIVRIVGIWIALIFAPAAFFATALPERLKRGMSAITNDYWSKLVGLLTGGPVIAFFLWLTLSVMQQSGSSTSGLAPALNLGVANGGAWLFPTDIGNSNSIASFVVGITLMLMGVGVAVQAAQSASSTFGSLAGKIAGAGQRFGGKLALAPIIAGGLAARGVDRRVDLTGRVSRGLLKVPGLRSLARKPLLKGATLRRREAKEKGSEEAKYLKHLNSSEQASIVNAYGKTAFSSFGERAAGAQILSLVTSEKGQKERRKEKTGELMKGKRYTSMEDQGEAKRLASMEAGNEIQKGSGALIKEGLSRAQAANDYDQVEKYQEQLAKNPLLSGSPDDIAKQMAKTRNDPEKLKSMSTDAKQSFSVALGALPENAMQLDSDGKTVKGFDQPSLERFYEQNAGNGELVETVKMAVNHVQKSDGKGVSKEELLSMQKQRTADGSVRLYGKAAKGGGYEQKQSEQYKKSRKAVETAFANGGGVVPAGSLDASTRASVDSALGQGVQISDIVKLGNSAQRRALGEHLSVVSAGGVSRASNATDKAGFDKAIQDSVNGWKQLDKVDTDLQVKILSGIQSGDSGAKVIAKIVRSPGLAKKNVALKVIKQAVARAEAISAKRASGKTINDDELKVEELLRSLTEELPESKRGGRNAAPSGVRKVLYRDEG